MVTQGTTITTTNYLNGYLYKNGVLQYFPTLEGYVEPNGSTFKYVFQHKDHLGNIRLSYTKNPTTNALDIIEENNFYPFGLRHAGYNTTIVGGVTEAQKIKYGSKEYQNELNLNVYDFGARVYNPEGGPAFWQIDPKAEQMRRWSPYSYAFNNPIYFIDPDGMAPIDWIVHLNSEGKTAVTYQENIKTKEQAEAAGYKGVKQVFQSGSIAGTDQNNVVYTYKLNEGGTVSNKNGEAVNMDKGFMTPQGTYVGENRSALSQLAPVLSNTGDAAVVAGAFMVATGVGAPIGAGLITYGGYASTTGTVMDLTNDINNDNLTTEKAVTKTAIWLLPQGGNAAFKSLGAPAASDLFNIGTIAADSTLDKMRETKTGPYKK